jgi:hypothetical protein
MRQTSLLSFLHGSKIPANPSTSQEVGNLHCDSMDSKNPKRVVNKKKYPYFYLSWDGKKPYQYAFFVEEKPSNINFTKSVFWKDAGYEIIVCGHFPHLQNVDIKNKSTYRHLYKLDKERKYRNTSLLKSLLQKAIRRKESSIAVKCAFHFMTLDIQEFLRRLPIIMIEDTSIHEVFPTLIWLMIAVTDETFLLDKSIYEYLMGVVYVISMIPTYVPIRGKCAPLILHEVPQSPLLSIIYALMLRRAYGGMKCDMTLCEEYAFMIYTQPKFNLERTKIRPILLESISELALSEWLTEAIDFHCTPQILTYIAEEYPEYDEEYIQKLIWHYSSKINGRIKEKSSPEVKYIDWKKIQPYVKRVQYYLLEEQY